MTNFERIKAMTIEEMAKHIDAEYGMHQFCTSGIDCTAIECDECIVAWLESEVQDEES